MKTRTKSTKIIPGNRTTGTKLPGKKHEEITPDLPLSEKDEVKQAEKRLRASQKKNG